MVYEEITPHLKKIVRIGLSNKKRMIGWLVVDHYHEISNEPLKEVHCVNVRYGKKYIQENKDFDMKDLKQEATVIQIKDILNIHSCK